ncbi:MAG: DNA-directed RNA polymerase subunit alpha C-terminal domain-containing protein [Planctomycetia bacterium]
MAPASTPVTDAQQFLDRLAFGSEDLRSAKDAVRTSREFRRVLETALRALPEGAGGSTSLKRATALYLLSRPEAAAPEAQKAGDTPQAQLVKARVALENGEPGEAARVLATLVGSEVDGPSLLADLATAAALSGDSSLAQKAASKIPAGADALYAQGIALESEGEYAEAKERYEAALAKDAQHVRALFRLALRLDLEGEDAKALEAYTRLMALPAAPANAFLNAGLLLEDAGRFSEAEACYQRVLKSDPNHVRARLGLRDCRASLNMHFDEDSERREDRVKQVLRTPISEFELSVRSRNCLAKMNIETLGDLVRKSEAELLAYKNFGETSLQEIKDILAQKKLRLGMQVEDDTDGLDLGTKPASDEDVSALFGGPDDEDEDDDEVGGDPRNDSIDALGLSIRTRRAVEALGIRTVGELTERSEAELREAKNFGGTCAMEVRKKLEELGLSLRA